MAGAMFAKQFEAASTYGESKPSSLPSKLENQALAIKHAAHGHGHDGPLPTYR